MSDSLDRNYVKFVRGSKSAYDKMIQRGRENEDTLYFITDEDEKIYLYLGDQLISCAAGGQGPGGATKISELVDVKLSARIQNKEILIYDSILKKWKNTALEDLDIITDIPIMIGATENDQGVSGLVPVPPRGSQSMFLRADGQWSPTPVGTLHYVDLGEGEPPPEDTETVMFSMNVGELKNYVYGAIQDGASADFSTLGKVENKVVNTQNQVTIMQTNVGNLQQQLTALSETVNNLTPQGFGNLVGDVQMLKEITTWQNLE